MQLSEILALFDTFESVVLVIMLAAAFAARKHIIAWFRSELKTEELYRDCICNRLMLNLYTRPDLVSAIEADYLKYKKLGGNSYIDEMVSEWRRGAKYLPRNYWSANALEGFRPEGTD